MYWKSFDEFIHMGGYGLYVWGSYFVTLGVLAVESHLASGRLKRAQLELRDGAHS